MFRQRRAAAVLLLYVFSLDTLVLAQGRLLAVSARPVVTPAVPVVPRAQANSPQAAVGGLPPHGNPGRSGDPGLAVAAGGDEVRPLDLRTFAPQGEPGIGLWDVSPDGRSAVQRTDGGTAFLVGPGSAVDVTYHGRVRVDGIGGAVGFVLGYRAPLLELGHATHQSDYVLFAWNGQATGAMASPSPAMLSRVLSAPASGATTDAQAEAAALPLAFTVDQGVTWHPGQDYAVEIRYRQTRVEIDIDGEPVLEAEGDFGAGRFGFYTRSQSGAHFADFTVQAANSAPVADAGTDQILEGTDSCSALTLLDGTQSSDPDGDALTSAWSGPFGEAFGASVEVAVPVGEHSVLLHVEDPAGLSDTDSLDISVSDAASPIIACPAPVVALTDPGQCVASGVDLGMAAATDNCGVVDLSHESLPSYPHGETTLVWGAVDEAGFLAQCIQTVTVKDVEAPRLEATLAVRQIWPPNHALVDAGLELELEDNCGSALTLHASVFSNEPANSTGDGNTELDAAIEAPDGLWLRAERKGNGNSRVYLVLLAATDLDGNTSHVCRAAFVPKSKSKSTVKDAEAQAAAAEAFCAANAAGPAGFEQITEGFLSQANRGPDVDAGPDRELLLPERSLVLAGSASDDGLPSPVLGVAWSQLSGPAGVTFADVTAPETAATFPGAGVYALRLTASDGALAASDEAIVVVRDRNQPPSVDAGPDAVTSLPDATLALAGTVADDGLPSATLETLWSLVSGPGPAAFAEPEAVATAVSFSNAGVHVLRLTVSDSELQASDDVTVTVLTPPIPELSVSDTEIVEGHRGEIEAQVDLVLSAPAAETILVDFITFDIRATEGRDYRARFGSVELPAGVTGASLTVTILGDLALEGDEELGVFFGNLVGASMSDPEARIVIRDDDEPNTALGTIEGRTPPDDSRGVVLSPTLAWGPLSDVAFDVHLADVWPTDGQSWLARTPVAAGPLARAGAAAAYDQDSDRLLLFGGELADGSVAGDVWVLADARATAAHPTWIAGTTLGPSPRQGATLIYDPATNRAILHGGCDQGCSAALSDTWVLTHANGLGGASEWLPLPDAPGPRDHHVAGYDPASNRMVVFGGDGTSVLWVLQDANGVGAPAWTSVDVAGLTPAARSEAAGVYDAASDRLIVFGGLDANGLVSSDVWILSDAVSGSPTWAAVSASGGPIARSGAAAGYEPVAQRLVVYGGATSGRAAGTHFVFGDAWVLDVGGATPAWSAITAPHGPAPRYLSASAYTLESGRLIVATGINDKQSPAYFDDAFVLSDAPGLLPVLAEGQSATEYVTDSLPPGVTQFWKLVARDSRGAERHASVWRFTPDHPLVSVADVAVTEGDSGEAHAIFTLTLSRPAEDVGSVVFETHDASALAGEDYTATTETVEFPVGVTSQTVDVPVLGDDVVEPDEWFEVRLSAPSALALDVAIASGTILNDDQPPPNQAPVVDAGPDQQVEIPGNQLVNPGAEDALVGGNLPGWIEVQGTAWTRRTVFGSGYPLPAEGAAYFHPGFANKSELAQSVDLTPWADRIDAGLARFYSRILVWAGGRDATWRARVILEYRDAGGAVLAATDTGLFQSPADWRPIVTHMLAPAGARMARLRLIADRLVSANDSDVYFDAASFRPFPEPTLFAVGGSVSDDGLPQGGMLDASWSVVAGPGGLAFSDASSAVTQATVTAPGIHVVRLTGGDGAATTFDDAALTVLASDLPPAVDAGPDQVFGPVEPPLGVNLLRNPGNELALIASDIPFWVEVSPEVNWRKAPTTSGYPSPFEGSSYFYADGTLIGELRQDVDVSAFADSVDAGGQAFSFGGRVRSRDVVILDPAQIVLEYRDAAGGVLTSFDSGDIANPLEWQRVEDTRAAPQGTRTIRVRLITRTEGAGLLDGFFDGLELYAPRPVDAPLLGTVADEGLPIGGDLTATWAFLRGPEGASVNIAFPGQAQTTVAPSGPVGSYTLRLTGSDGAQSSHDDMFVIVDPGNQPPAVYVGEDQTLASTASPLTVRAHVSDDGLPGAALSHLWSRVSGPGTVTFSAPTSVTSGLSFSIRGVYVVRLTTSDGERAGFDDLRVWVNGTNLPPSADAGADQFVDGYVAALTGVASDDGLPSPGTLLITWSVVSGPAAATFDDPYAASTTARFAAPGTYVLRLLVSDSVATAEDEVSIEVAPSVPLPDLVVLSLDTAGVFYDASSLALAGTASVTVFNAGAGDAPESVLSVFEDLDGDGALGAADQAVGTLVVPALAAGEGATLDVGVIGSITFPGAHLFAFADSASAVVETDETNNLASSAPACQERSEFAPFDPVLKWAWTSSSAEPDATSVTALPAVFDLDGDGVPEVIFASYAPFAATPGQGEPGVLRVVSGRDGSELFSIDDPLLRVHSGATPAVGDIDGDGNVEIVALNDAGTRVLAFEHDGRLKWRSAAVELSTSGAGNGHQAPALADLDGDGLAEVVLGREVLNPDGTLRWRGVAGKTGEGLFGTASIVADLDMDGSPEVITGNTAYRANGSIYWERNGVPSGGLPTIPDGYPAIGNFDADPFPEIVTVGNGEVRMLEHDGALKWGPVLLPIGAGGTLRGRGGPPLVADVDRDGVAEIGVAGATAYAVFESDGTLKWSRPIQDLTSNRTGGSAFDFEGDGSSELLYADEVKLHVFNGSDGTTLFERPLGSVTKLEYPLVVDVDADGRAEIVGIANLYQQTENHGVYVFTDAADQWVPTRRVWNQHSYHVTNIEDSGRVPGREAPSWLAYNSYRQNHLIEGCVFAQPDLLPSFVRKQPAPGGTLVTARIGNKGGSLAGPGIPVSFYDGDPTAGGTLLGSVTTSSPLAPARYEDVAFLVPDGTAALPVYVNADDDGTGNGVRAESDETNNLYASSVYVTPTPNETPQVELGGTRYLELPATQLIVSAVVTDDGQPIDELSGTWGLVSGPAGASVAFDPPTYACAGAPCAPSATLTLADVGEYRVRLTAFDRDMAGQGEATIVVTPPNVAPIVEAGPDRRLYSPATTMRLTGSVTDDGLPLPYVPTALWSVVSAPLGGSATLACLGSTEPPASSCSCTGLDPSTGHGVCAVDVMPDTLGDYVLRLSADDGRGAVGDDLVVSFLPERTDQPPSADAGSDQNLSLGANLVVNPGAEDGIAGWTPGPGTEWDVSGSDVIEGRFRFVTTGGGLSQDIPVAALRGSKLSLEVWHRTSDLNGGAVVIAEVWNAQDPFPLYVFQTLDTIRETNWTPLRAAFGVFPGADFVRLRIIASGIGAGGVTFDGISLRVTSGVADLSGSAVDDGLPVPPSLAATWSLVAEPTAGAATFGACAEAGGAAGCSCTSTDAGLDGDQTQVVCAVPVALSQGGDYTFRLSTFDGASTGADDVTLSLGAPNVRPRVGAGPDLNVTLPSNQVVLAGRASDPDAGPQALFVLWEQLSGPAALELDDVTAPVTNARATRAGTYALRLRASDGDHFAFDDMTLVVASDGTENQPPSLYPGPGGLVRLPEVALPLAGLVQDDGLPEGQDLAISWSVVSGIVGGAPCTGTECFVVIEDEISCTGTGGSGTFTGTCTAGGSASFTAAGQYSLRLTASDGEYTVTADTPVSVLPPGETNVEPLVEAGPDETVSLPLATVALSGAATDDGNPVGASLGVGWTVLAGSGISSTCMAPCGGVAIVEAPHCETDTGTGAEACSAAATATLASAGTYVLRLTADDGQILATDDLVVRVLPENTPPVVDAGPDREITLPPDTAVPLGAGVSDDGLPLGSTPTAAWTVVSVSGAGDCTFPCGASFEDASRADTTVTLTRRGTYLLRLTASDGEHTVFDEATVTVHPGPNQPPMVDAGPDQTLSLPTHDTTLTAAVTDEGLPEGSRVTLQWAQAVGPADGRASFVAPFAASTAVSFDKPGTYVLRLIASDGELSTSDDMVVTLQAGTATGAGPVVTLLTPQGGASLTEPTAVTGTVAGNAIVGWRLEHRLANESGWSVFASGEGGASGTLATFDTSLLLNGTHTLRLVANDAAGRTSSTVAKVVVRDNLKVGNFSVSFVDLEVPLSGMPIRVTRTYDSREKRKGDFGYGWSLDISSVELDEANDLASGWLGTATQGSIKLYCVEPVGTPLVTVTFPGGDVHEFDVAFRPEATKNVLGIEHCQQFVRPFSGRVIFKPRPGTLSTLRPLDSSDAPFIIGGFPGSLQLFDESDYNLWNPSLYELKLPDGRVFVIDDVDGLRSVSDANGNTLSVTPTGLVHSSGASVTWVRDAQGRITTLTDPEGDVTRYAYDANGDLRSVTDREENTTGFAYLATRPHHLESIEDPRGIQPIRNDYDDSGRLTRHTDAFGKTIEYAHDLNARQEIVQDRNGAIRVLEYDTRGNVIRETQPDGRLILRTFDVRNNRLSETEPHEPGTPDPATTSFTYDARNNLLSTTDPLGNTTRQTYDARGNVLTTTDARNQVTTNTYDAKSNLLKTTDAHGNETTFTYDTRGNVVTQTDAANQTTTFEYDFFGNLTKETDALGHVTAFTYDRKGNRLTQTTSRNLFTCAAGSCTPTGTETLATTFVYDRLGLLTRTIDSDGTFTRTQYDALGKQTKSIDKLGRETSFEYDPMGRLVTTTYPDLTTEESSYDYEGRRLTSTDRAGRTTTYDYDPQGRLTKTTFPDDSFTENNYDAAGRLESTRDARGSLTRYEYDAGGRRTKVIDALLQETAFTYEANGNQQTVTDPRGKTTTFAYDDLNRRTRTTFHDGTFTETGYDALGRRISETDQAGKTTRFEYDVLGRLTKVKDTLNQETVYHYDELGNRIAQTDANGHTTSFEYDALGRQTKRIFPDGAFEQMAYDPAGNLETRTDFMGRTTGFAYDASGRLTTKTFADASQVAYTYTTTGRRETVTDARGMTTYAYDVRDRLQSLTYPDGRRLEYEHDAQGNRTKLTAILTAASLVTTSTFDPLGRLQTVTDPALAAYGHAYDPNGNRATLVHPNGVETAYTYDDLNRLTNLTSVGPLQTIQSYAFALGPAGNRTRIDEHDGTVREYGYDDLYRLTSETVSDTVGAVYSKTFSYDPVGNRRQQTTTGAGAPDTPTAPGTEDSTYDARDRLSVILRSNGEAQTTKNLAYDANGNLISKDAEGTYTWDFEDRLIRVDKTDGTVVEHVYDADGNRVRTTTTPAGGTPEVTDYLVDTSGSLSHAVAETDATGNLVAYYVRGDDLLVVLRPDGSDAFTPRYYHADGLGSIRRLTDAAGNITDGYSYSAFGELLAHTGSDPQPYAFTGEPLDPNTGWQYHRARWMDPSIGRFASVDPWRGSVFEPATLHRYLYANADAVNRIDPSGRESLQTQLTTISAAVTVFLSNFGASLGNAFRQGGPVLGQFFWSIGTYAQGTGMEIIYAYQRFKPALEVVPERLAGSGTRVIDVFLRLGDRAAWIEMKFGLPWKWGEALTRLVDQVRQALATGEGEVVLWSMREPVVRQVNLLKNALGDDYARMRLVHGVQGLGQWLSEFFGGV